MGGIFKTSETKICLYADRNDPVKKVKLIMQEETILGKKRAKRLAFSWRKGIHS